MKASGSVLNIVRVGNNITFSSLKEIGGNILEVFKGIIKEFELLHHDSPAVNNIDAFLLTTILNEEIGGHILGITDVNLTTSDDNEFYNSIIGGKNPRNDVAVVSTRKLVPSEMISYRDYELFIKRTLKVSLHEIGHNFGLTDHGSYRSARDGSLCPMSKGEFNKFGYRGYVRAIVDGRGMSFCDECTRFLKEIYAFRGKLKNLLADGLTSGLDTAKEAGP
jgi:predicted Zn-dependent protease